MVVTRKSLACTGSRFESTKIQLLDVERSFFCSLLPYLYTFRKSGLQLERQRIGRTLHGMVWTVKLITVWFEAAPPPAGHTSPPAKTNHLTVKQRCRCTPAKNQPQTNDFRLRAGLHEMHLFFWRAPWSSKVLHCSSRFQSSRTDDGGRIQTFYLEQMNMKFQTHDWIIIQSFDLIGDN